MNPSIITIILHLGTVLKTLKDIEKAVQDAVSGKASKSDLADVMNDIISLFQSGVLNVPGITSDQIVASLQDVQKTLLS